MNIIKKSLSVMLAAVIILQAGAFTVFAESAEDEKQVITISNIDTSQLTGEAAESTRKGQGNLYKSFRKQNNQDR